MSSPSPSPPSPSPSPPPLLRPSADQLAATSGPAAPAKPWVFEEWRNFHRHLPEVWQARCKEVAGFMDGAIVLCIIAVATLITIFLDDIRVASFGPNADYNFAVITAFLLALFGLEMLINCLVKPGYFLSSFFLLDLVSAFSLLPDIPWIWNPMIGLHSGDWGPSSPDATITEEVDRIKRISHNGQQLLKVLKFVKLIRLGRIAKLFEMAQRTLKERERQKRILSRKDDPDKTIHADDYTQSSQVGQSLSEQTIRNVVLLVLLMLFGIPLLQPTTQDEEFQLTIDNADFLAGDTVIFHPTLAAVASDGTYTPITESERSAYVAAGQTVILVNGSDIARMLVNYSAVLGQPLDKTTFPSGDVNLTYLATVVDPKVYNLTAAVLQDARIMMEAQFAFNLAYFDTLLYMRIRNQYYSNDYESPQLWTLRTTEMRACVSGASSVGVFSTQSEVVQAANYSIWRTFTTLLLLFIGAVAFDHNNKRMVIIPIERMVATIVQLRKNPLAKAIIDDEDEAVKTEAKTEALSNNETGMLERTLQKLTGLLQVGFGDAGSRMIKKCMSTDTGDFDPLVPGTRILAIFGFCDIRRFTDATELLREDVMKYVNRIADIVHFNTSTCDGHPNKNIGDAFLVMWKLNPAGAAFDTDDLFQLMEIQPTYMRPSLETLRRRAKLTTQAEKDYEAEQQRRVEQALLNERIKQASASPVPVRRTISPVTRAQLSIWADKSVTAFLRTIIDLDGSEDLRKWEAKLNDPKINTEYDPAITPDAATRPKFIVQLGFGLHCGWSIEGPIGSRYKIDASYLSPHVNISEALQDLTKTYGTPLLISGEFYTLLSPYMKSFMRRVDVVKIGGRDIPLNLYAFDIHPTAMRNILDLQLPEGYDVKADIDVVELKPSHFTRWQPPMASPRDGQTTTIQIPEEPLSPQSPYDAQADPLTTHPLFKNRALNPRVETGEGMDFSQYHFTAAEREEIHQYSPIGRHHLIEGDYNVRLSALQCGIPYEFYDVYAAGLDAYLAGDWPAARIKMDECRLLYPEDVSTKVILEVMEEHQFIAPDSWPGWHEA